MNYQKLGKILAKEPKYRLAQAERAVYIDLISDWQEASVLPLALREKLNAECPLAIDGEILTGNRQTEKALVKFADGESVEAVIISHRDERNTLCVSSQIGCPIGCSFCATGQMGFKRNLYDSEIVDQFLFFARHLKKTNQKITNVVFMGMGEPFLNYDHVISAIRMLNDPAKFNFGARRISISTCGLVPGIDKLASEDLQVNLAISLHSADDDLRSRLVPMNNEYNLTKLFKAVDRYIEKTSRRVMFEYLLIDGINDSPAQARELAKKMKKLYLVNLITYNHTGGEFKPSSPEARRLFKQILEQERVAVTERISFGDDIDAACGQLATKRK